VRRQPVVSLITSPPPSLCAVSLPWRRSVAFTDATRPPPGRYPCDLVFLDPPYRSGQAAPALAALAAAGWVAPDAVVTVELAHNEDIAPPEGFEAIDERRYGAAKIVILRGKP
jgi:16S rRNA (guanine966-N2)-methyltransferase